MSNSPLALQLANAARKEEVLALKTEVRKLQRQKAKLQAKNISLEAENVTQRRTIKNYEKNQEAKRTVPQDPTEVARGVAFLLAQAGMRVVDADDNPVMPK